MATDLESDSNLFGGTVLEGFSFSVARQPLAFSLSMPHDHTHLDTPHSVGLPCTSDQPQCRDIYLTIHNTQRRQTSMPLAGFEPTNPAREWSQAHALDSAVIVIGNVVEILGDSFGTRPKKLRISQRLFVRFWTCIYDYIPCFMKSMSILEEMLEMFATTIQAELNATLHVCESGLQDVLSNRSNFTSNVVFQFLYGARLVGVSFSF